MTGKKFFQQLSYGCSFVSGMMLACSFGMVLSTPPGNAWPPFITSLVFGFFAFISWSGDNSDVKYY